MPICSATRRGAETSSREQQRPDPEGAPPSADASSGRRRWFHNCMVMPTTVRPSRTSMAATVELSTPPLMATAMGRELAGGSACPTETATAMGDSGMHRDPAQMRDAGADGFDERVHVRGGVGAAEGEAHAGAGAEVTQADGFQDVRRGERSARAGRPGGDGEATQVERDDHGFTIDAVEVDIGGIGQAVPARTVDAGARNAVQDGVLQAIAQHGEAFGVLGHAPGGEFRGGAEGGDAGDVLGARAAVAFVMAAVHDGREAGALAYVERAYALGRIELVTAHAVEVHAERLDVHGDFAERLHAIHVEGGAGLVGDPGDFGDGLER